MVTVYPFNAGPLHAQLHNNLMISSLSMIQKQQDYKMESQTPIDNFDSTENRNQETLLTTKFLDFVGHCQHISVSILST